MGVLGDSSPGGGIRQSFSPTTIADHHQQNHHPNYMAQNSNSPVQLQSHSFTPPPAPPPLSSVMSMHHHQQQSFFRETSMTQLNSSNNGSHNSYQMPLFEAFNEDDEEELNGGDDDDENDDDDDDDEDALYRNFVDADDRHHQPRRNGHLDMGTPSSAHHPGSQHHLYASANFEANSNFNGELNSNSFLTRSFPSTSSSMMMMGGGGGADDQLSASFIQSTKQLSTFDPSASFEGELPSNSSSTNIYICYWVDCYKQFSSQSQLVSQHLLMF